MANKYTYIENEITQKSPSLTTAFDRANKIPVDRSSLHFSYEDAVNYAKGDGTDIRKLGRTAHEGQIITIVGQNEDDKYGSWVYKLVPYTYYKDKDLPRGYRIKNINLDDTCQFLIEPVGIETEAITTDEIVEIVNPTIGGSTN